MAATEADLAAENARLRAQVGELEARCTAAEQRLRTAGDRLVAIAAVMAELVTRPDDQDHTLRTITDAALRLCHADRGRIYLRDGQDLIVGPNPTGVAPTSYRVPGTRLPAADMGPAFEEAMATGKAVHRPDTRAFAEALGLPRLLALSEETGDRTSLIVPLMLRGKARGVVALTHVGEVRPFSAGEIALAEAFAAQAALAVEMARLFAEVHEALEQQTATSEILSIISTSPTDLQPVFAAVAERAQRLLVGDSAILGVRAGDHLRIVAEVGPTYGARRDQPVPRSVPLTDDTPLRRVVREARTLHLHGTPEEVWRDNPQRASELRALGWERLATVVVPLLHDGTALGGIAVGHADGLPFTERQIALLENFAAQVVIAMQNTRLFNDLREALAQQTATSEILSIISTSPTNLQPVFQAMAERAQLLLGSDTALVVLREGDDLRYVAEVGHTPSAELNQPLPGTRLPDDAPTMRAVREARRIHVHGTPDDIKPEYPSYAELLRTAGYEHRSMLIVPLLHARAALGAIIVARADGVPFSDRQIALLETFAAQVVIAMQNTRLFNQLQQSNASLREALEQQTATAEILSIISTSPTDLQPVFQAVAERAQRLLGSDTATIVLRDGDAARFVADVGPTLSAARHRPVPRVEPLADGHPLTDALRHARTVHFHGTAGELARHAPELAEQWRLAGFERRSLVWVPLLHAGAALGVIGVVRNDGVPFTERQVALLETFAAQVVIAMQNTRLFNDLQQSNREQAEALERERATAEILELIGRVPTDLQAVLDTIAERAARLLRADRAHVHRLVGDSLPLVASSEMNGDFPGQLNQPSLTFDLAERGRLTVLAVQHRQTVHRFGGADAIAAHYPDLASFWSGDIGSAVAVPLVNAEAVFGALFLVRQSPEPFTAVQIALLETFADQAVIAIENARLFDALQQRTQELEETNRQLDEARRHTSAFLSAMSHELRTPLNAVIGYAEMLAEDAADAGYDGMLPDLAKIGASGRHLLSLIANVLDIAKIEAGKMELLVADFTVESLLTEVEAVAAPLMEQHRNRFVVVGASASGHMRTDKTKLRQALLNIISNAAKFTEQGIVSLAVTRTQEPTGQWLTFAVADTGIGVPVDQLGRLFTSFTQAEARISTQYGGTGLGLALTREFCRLLGGDITVESAPGTGSTFTIRLPATVPTATRSDG